jgi:uncharacterized protein (TIGR03083 family)
MNGNVDLSVDEVWRAIDGQRTSLADLLADLSDEEWRRPSLCAGWTVRDVAAHMTMQQLTIGAALGMVLKHPALSMDRMIQEATRRRAALPTAQLIADIRAMVGSRRHNVGVTFRETLIDILVHGQDIAIPLGRPHDMPPAAAAVAATRAWTMRFPPPFPARRKMSALKLTATDVAWTVGDGPEVRGPIAALLLVLCGRTIALPQLTGDGAAELNARLATPVS